jgi:hypothetical protein
VAFLHSLAPERAERLWLHSVGLWITIADEWEFLVARLRKCKGSPRNRMIEGATPWLSLNGGVEFRAAGTVVLTPFD